MEGPYQSLKVSTVADGVAEVTLNNPKKMNTMGKAFWDEIRIAFERIADNKNINGF